MEKRIFSKNQYIRDMGWDMFGLCESWITVCDGAETFNNCKKMIGSDGWEYECHKDWTVTPEEYAKENEECKR